MHHVLSTVQRDVRQGSEKRSGNFIFKVCSCVFTMGQITTCYIKRSHLGVTSSENNPVSKNVTFQYNKMALSITFRGNIFQRRAHVFEIVAVLNMWLTL